MFLPWLMRRRRAPAIEVDADRCTGCRLCVADCPYDALHLIDLEDAAHPHLAVVTEDKCVGCGICVGSCPVNALAFPGYPADALWDETSRAAATGSAVTFTCERHDAHSDAGEHGGDGPSRAVCGNGAPVAHRLGAGCPVPPPCTSWDARPATAPTGKARVTLAARLNRERRPRLKRRYLAAPISTDWVSPTRLANAISAPGRVPDATLAPPVAGPTRRLALPLLALVAVTAVLTILVTGFRFDPGGNDEAVLEVSLDHRAGVPLLGFEPFEAAPTGARPRLSIESDGAVLFDDSLAVGRADEADTALFFERFALEPGTHRIRITLADAPDRPLVLFEDTVSHRPRRGAGSQLPGCLAR